MDEYDKMMYSKAGERRCLIEFIKGTVEYINPEYVVVENNGVGYQIYKRNPFDFKIEIHENI